MATASNNSSSQAVPVPGPGAAAPAALPPKVPAPAPSPAPAEPTPPVLRGESQYDRVTSMLMSVVIAAGFLVGFLYLVYLTNHAYAMRVTNPLEIVEVFGGEAGGGAPEGDPNDDGGAVDVAGAEAADAASNSDSDAPDFEEPSLQQVSATALDMTAPLGDTTEMDVGAAVSSSNLTATGPRRSRAGTGRVGLGPGGAGDGGVRREQRWSVNYNPGQTPEEYARQLDSFGVEIGVIRNGAMTYVSKLSSATPQTRIGQHASDNRLFFVWQSNTRKASDVELLRKAGIEVGDSPIFHFYPKAIEDTLAQLEFKHRGKQPAEIKATRFSVVARGGTYGFAVLTQEPLTR